MTTHYLVRSADGAEHVVDDQSTALAIASAKKGARAFRLTAHCTWNRHGVAHDGRIDTRGMGPGVANLAEPEVPAGATKSTWYVVGSTSGIGQVIRRFASDSEARAMLDAPLHEGATVTSTIAWPIS